MLQGTMPYLLNINEHEQGSLVPERQRVWVPFQWHRLSLRKESQEPLKGLSRTMIVGQLLCDKIHSFFSATGRLLVTIVSLMLKYSSALS